MKTLRVIFSVLGGLLTLALLIIGWKVYLETGSGFEGTVDAIYHCGLIASTALMFAPLWIFD